LPDPLHDIPLLKARRLIHGLFLVPQARHLRLLLPQASIGSHDRPVFAILVPRAGDRPAVDDFFFAVDAAKRGERALPNACSRSRSIVDFVGPRGDRASRNIIEPVADRG
jgi:hypothetical protein